MSGLLQMALKKFCTVTTVGNKNVKVASLRVGTCSAAPVAQNEKSLNSAIANQTPKLVEQDHSAMLLIENSVSGEGVKANHERESSAALVVNPENWSHEAIVARANARTERMQKLTRCGEFGGESRIGLLARVLE
ncbi:hypothetical protein [Nostoc sp.]